MAHVALFLALSGLTHSETITVKSVQLTPGNEPVSGAEMKIKTKLLNYKERLCGSRVCRK